jgi:pSer/pThr/pTyr-binding forkhead associated (FHA) protein
VGHSTLQVVFRGQVVQSVPLDRPVLRIGRLRENEVVIDSLAVSRHHARLLVEGERVVLEDLGSGNGCVVNGLRVTRATLTPDDEVFIGKHQLVLRPPESETALDGPREEAEPSGPPPTPWDDAGTYFVAAPEPEGPQAAPAAPPAPAETPVGPEGDRHAGLILQLRGRLDRIVSVERCPFVIGRAPDCDLVLPEAGVSRHHVRLVQEGGSFVLEDLGGVNGTWVGGERIRRHSLGVGDEITIDEYRITFVLETRPLAEEIRVAGAPPAAPAAPPPPAALAETAPPAAPPGPPPAEVVEAEPEDAWGLGETEAEVWVAGPGGEPEEVEVEPEPDPAAFAEAELEPGDAAFAGEEPAASDGPGGGVESPEPGCDAGLEPGALDPEALAEETATEGLAADPEASWGLEPGLALSEVEAGGEPLELEVREPETEAWEAPCGPARLEVELDLDELPEPLREALANLEPRELRVSAVLRVRTRRT